MSTKYQIEKTANYINYLKFVRGLKKAIQARPGLTEHLSDQVGKLINSYVGFEVKKLPLTRIIELFYFYEILEQ